MWIEKMYATFGKLNCKELTLKNGLNIVCGANESGKSTWSAFIRAMLYGIPTREKARNGYLPDKEKFMPWSGSPMYGRMHLASDGKLITIERTAGRSGVLSTVKSSYDSTGAPAPSGEELIGTAREIYERTAFIGQSRLKVDRDGEIERRILSLAGSGDEEVSFGEVKARLQAKKRTIRTVRDGGELPRIEAEIAKTLQQLEEAEQLSSALDSSNQRIKELTLSTTSAEREIAIKKASQNAEREAFVKNATAELESARKEADLLRNSPGREVLASYSSLVRERASAEIKLNLLLLTQNELEQAAQNIRNAASHDSAFAGLSKPEAEARAENDIKRLLSSYEKHKGRLLAPAFSLASLVSAGFALAVNAPVWRIVLISAFALFSVAALVIFIRSKKGSAKSDKALLEELYGEASEEKILACLGNYLTALYNLEEAEQSVKNGEGSISQARRHIEELHREILSALENAGLEGLSAEEGELRMAELVQKREAALRAEAEAQIRVNAITKTSVNDQVGDICYTDDEIPSESLAELHAKYNELSRVLREYELSVASLKARTAELDCAELQKNLDLLEARRDELMLSCDALDMAIEELGLAEQELRARFAPEVSRRAAEIFHDLTGGSFEAVRILNSNFDMEVFQNAASAPRDTLHLSQGTLDELYLSLRLALCEFILDNDNPPPMILDDAFVNFDETRLAKALDLIKKHAESRQIILFTCHEREAMHFEGASDVNIVHLA